MHSSDQLTDGKYDNYAEPFNVDPASVAMGLEDSMAEISGGLDPWNATVPSEDFSHHEAV
ncbi:hypothetical protein AC578_7041 [Pseudocercospora eumusae]|uniref:Uncharacterized protein n=1 Tax=Pseudocercospora eumusae TaxID=321146 RepID=A0A139GVX1_9PEZI|nr:hypothetical protein AC578_7041 [Pseudocercospora eumusae]